MLISYVMFCCDFEFGYLVLQRGGVYLAGDIGQWVLPLFVLSMLTYLSERQI